MYRVAILLFLVASFVGLLLVEKPYILHVMSLVGTDLSRPSRRLIAEKDVINWSLHTFPLAVGSRWKYVAFTLALVCACVAISVFAYTRFQSPARQVLASDAQGSVAITDTGNMTHQLEAFKRDGTRQWTLFSSEGVFSVPKAQMQAGTLLVALRGDTADKNIVAGDDPAYPRPLDSMFALYLLNRTTGHILWQQIVSYPDEQQRSEVVGGDATYIYVAGEHMAASSAQADVKNVTVPQLFAVNKLTGMVDWRIFGPAQPAGTKHIASTVLTQSGLVVWHVANTVFTIDANVGQIIGRT